MKQNKVDFDHKLRVKHYLDYVSSTKGFFGDLKKENETISLLNTTLRREVTVKNNERVLAQIPQIMHHFSKDVLRQVIKIMTKINLGSDTVIFKVKLAKFFF